MSEAMPKAANVLASLSNNEAKARGRGDENLGGKDGRDAKRSRRDDPEKSAAVLDMELILKCLEGAHASTEARYGATLNHRLLAVVTLCLTVSMVKSEVSSSRESDRVDGMAIAAYSFATIELGKKYGQDALDKISLELVVSKPQAVAHAAEIEFYASLERARQIEAGIPASGEAGEAGGSVFIFRGRQDLAPAVSVGTAPRVASSVPGSAPGQLLVSSASGIGGGSEHAGNASTEVGLNTKPKVEDPFSSDSLQQRILTPSVEVNVSDLATNFCMVLLNMVLIMMKLWMSVYGWLDFRGGEWNLSVFGEFGLEFVNFFLSLGCVFLSLVLIETERIKEEIEENVGWNARFSRVWGYALSDKTYEHAMFKLRTITFVIAVICSVRHWWCLYIRYTKEHLQKNSEARAYLNRYRSGYFAGNLACLFMLLVVNSYLNTSSKLFQTKENAGRCPSLFYNDRFCRGPTMFEMARKPYVDKIPFIGTGSWFPWGGKNRTKA